jgi:hypothetical protein
LLVLALEKIHGRVHCIAILQYCSSLANLAASHTPACVKGARIHQEKTSLLLQYCNGVIVAITLLRWAEFVDIEEAFRLMVAAGCRRWQAEQ